MSENLETIALTETRYDIANSNQIEGDVSARGAEGILYIITGMAVLYGIASLIKNSGRKIRRFYQRHMLENKDL